MYFVFTGSFKPLSSLKASISEGGLPVYMSLLKDACLGCMSVSKKVIYVMASNMSIAKMILNE
jgi:hypothetical protein